MIEVKNLHKSLGGLEVLRGIDLSVQEGEVISLLGASGSGKSVLLRNIVGLMHPDRGFVRIDGVNVHEVRGRKLEQVRDNIGMLFQGGALFDSMSVYENLAFPLREKTDLDPPGIDRRVKERLERVEMADAEAKYPAELSGGMQKRVALARALIRDPELIFFDEPTTGLDPLIANAILRLVHRLHRELSFTAVVVTHNFQKVFQIVDKVAMLHEGKIIAYNRPDQFLESDHPRVRTFVNEAVKGPLEAIQNGTVD